MTASLNFLKKHFLLASIFCLFVIGGGFAYALREKEVKYESVSAVRKDIVKEVSVTGKVKPAKDAELAFEQGGKISGIFVQEGSRVAVGRVLARQESGTVAADLVEARAAVRVQEAVLAELRRGTRAEEVDVERRRVESARGDVSQAVRAIATILEDSYSKAEDAVRNKSDKLYENPETSGPRIVFDTSNSSLKGEVEAGRVAMGILLSTWKKELDPGILSTLSEEKTISLAADSKSRLSQVRMFLDKLTLVLTYAIPSGSVTQTTVDGYRADVSSARASINTALASLSSDVEALEKSRSALRLAESSLSLKEAPKTPEEIAKQIGTLEQARAKVLSTEARAAKYSLVAPIAGTITKVHAESGEIASAGMPVVSIISAAAFQIEAFVPETDISLVRTGSAARVTLDAYGDSEVWDVKVLSVDPAETVIDGVSTYKTILEFLKSDDDRVKSGMTANVEILSEKKENVISLPRRFISEKEGKHMVLIPAGEGEPQEREVVVGITGSDGSVEILSGLSEGEVVVMLKQ